MTVQCARGQFGSMGDRSLLAEADSPFAGWQSSFHRRAVESAPAAGSCWYSGRARAAARGSPAADRIESRRAGMRRGRDLAGGVLMSTEASEPRDTPAAAALSDSI